MIGALPAGIVQGLFPQGQMQTAAEPFVYGAGGRRMTPEDITRERRIAASLMGVDASPVQHWSQGLARVMGNVTGALRERKADKASQQNADYSAQIAQSLLNPSGTPSASALPGAASSTAPGGNSLMDTGRIAQMVLADPYIDANTKALAQMQLEQQQKFAMKKFEYANRELPEVAQLARLANDTMQPEHIRKAAQDRITAMNDPMQIIPGVNGGTYVGRASGISGAMGGEMPAPGTVVADPRKQGGQAATPPATFR